MISFRQRWSKPHWTMWRSTHNQPWVVHDYTTIRLQWQDMQNTTTYVRIKLFFQHTPAQRLWILYVEAAWHRLFRCLRNQSIPPNMPKNNLVLTINGLMATGVRWLSWCKDAYYEWSHTKSGPHGVDLEGFLPIPGTWGWVLLSRGFWKFVLQISEKLLNGLSWILGYT